jgi:chromosome segregation ATPase
MITEQLLAEIDTLKDKLLETQKDLSFRRDLYALQNQLVDQLSKDLTEARAEAKKWKDNHDNQVKINQLLRDRPDLGDRAKSVDALIKQRDAVVEALETVLDEVRNDYMACKDEIKAALAAVKGSQHE